MFRVWVSPSVCLSQDGPGLLLLYLWWEGSLFKLGFNMTSQDWCFVKFCVLRTCALMHSDLLLFCRGIWLQEWFSKSRILFTRLRFLEGCREMYQIWSSTARLTVHPILKNPLVDSWHPFLVLISSVLFRLCLLVVCLVKPCSMKTQWEKSGSRRRVQPYQLTLPWIFILNSTSHFGMDPSW